MRWHEVEGLGAAWISHNVAYRSAAVGSWQSSQGSRPLIRNGLIYLADQVQHKLKTIVVAVQKLIDAVKTVGLSDGIQANAVQIRPHQVSIQEFTTIVGIYFADG